jgi:hypothetical protein
MGVLRMPQLQILLKAVQDAQLALAEHIEPRGPDERTTINKLLAILDDRHVVAAVWMLTGKKLSTEDEIDFLEDLDAGRAPVFHTHDRQ